MVTTAIVAMAAIDVAMRPPVFSCSSVDDESPSNVSCMTSPPVAMTTDLVLRAVTTNGSVFSAVGLQASAAVRQDSEQVRMCSCDYVFTDAAPEGDYVNGFVG
jgi:hypothetical protein